MKEICVIGSLNMDLVVNTPRFPAPGETIIGDSFATFPGGKGANQAVAAARLGAAVRMAGKLGDDLYGDRYERVLSEEGVRADDVQRAKGSSSGVAAIQVDASGENSIVWVAGANGLVDREYVDQVWDRVADADIFLLQLELPLETVEYALSRLKADGKVTILDPAPAQELPDSFYRHVDFLTPNEAETAALTGIVPDTEDRVREAARQLVGKGTNTVVFKVGGRGAYVARDDAFEHVGGFQVEVKDTTAAGDAFNAGLAVALARGLDLTEAVRYANATGALATTATGAQTALPSGDAVRKLLG
jgi:ribokinase